MNPLPKRTGISYKCQQVHEEVISDSTFGLPVAGICPINISATCGDPFAAQGRSNRKMAGRSRREQAPVKREGQRIS
jgi:hypothetical protein